MQDFVYASFLRRERCRLGELLLRRSSAHHHIRDGARRFIARERRTLEVLDGDICGCEALRPTVFGEPAVVAPHQGRERVGHDGRQGMKKPKQQKGLPAQLLPAERPKGRRTLTLTLTLTLTPFVFPRKNYVIMWPSFVTSSSSLSLSLPPRRPARAFSPSISVS